MCHVYQTKWKRNKTVLSELCVTYVTVFDDKTYDLGTNQVEWEFCKYLTQKKYLIGIIRHAYKYLIFVWDNYSCQNYNVLISRSKVTLKHICLYVPSNWSASFPSYMNSYSNLTFNTMDYSYSNNGIQGSTSYQIPSGASRCDFQCLCCVKLQMVQETSCNIIKKNSIHIKSVWYLRGKCVLSHARGVWCWWRYKRILIYDSWQPGLLHNSDVLS